MIAYKQHDSRNFGNKVTASLKHGFTTFQPYNCMKELPSKNTYILQLIKEHRIINFITSMQ